MAAAQGEGPGSGWGGKREEPAGAWVGGAAAVAGDGDAVQLTVRACSQSWLPTRLVWSPCHAALLKTDKVLFQCFYGFNL